MGSSFDPASSATSDAELKRRREQIHLGLRRANTAALLALLIVVGFSLAAILQAFRAGGNAREAGQARQHAEEEMQKAQLAQARALLEQARAQRRTGEAGQRFGSIAAVSAAVAIRPSAELRQEAIAALALPDVRFVPVWTNPHPNLVAQFSPSLTQIAAGVPRGAIEILRASDGQAESVLPSAGPAVMQAWFSPDGRFMAAQYYGGSNVIWDLPTKNAALGWGPSRSSAEFAPDNQHVLVADAPGVARCLALVGGKELWHCDVSPGWAGFAAQLQGKYFAAWPQGKSTAQVRKMDTGDLVREITHPSPIGAVTWSRDGKSVVVGMENGWLDIWEVESGTQTATWRAHNDAVVALSSDPGGRWLASSSWDRTVRFWSLPGYRLAVSAGGYDAQSIARFSADGRQFACRRNPETLGFLELAASPVLRRVYVPPSEARGAWSVDVSPDGKLVAAGYGDGLVLLDFPTGRKLDWRSVADCRSVLFTPNGAGLLSCGASGLVYWPVEHTTETPANAIRLGEPKELREERGFVYAALSANGQWVAAAHRKNGSVTICNINDSTKRFELFNHPGVQFPALSADGRWLASGTWKGRGVRIWDLASRQLVTELPVEESATVNFSPNSQLLVTGSRCFQVWETGSWRERYRSPEIDTVGPPAAFGPNNQLLAVLKTPRTVELLEADTGRVLADLEAPNSAPVSGLRFTPDGTSLLALEWTSEIQVWDLRHLHQELAGLGLDWETRVGLSGPGRSVGEDIETEPPASLAQPPGLKAARRSATAGSGPLASAAPGALFYFLAMGGVAVSVLIGIYTLRYNRRMIRGYEEVESLVAQGHEELKSARTELLDSQKMRALGTLAAGIAHDFNNLLSIIRMSNKLIDRQARGQAEIQEHVTDIEQAVLQGKSLVGSMLGYARNEAGTSGPTDVKLVVENAVSLLSKEFLSGIELASELDRAAPHVDLAHGRLEQVLLNLLVNASEAMQGQGKLKIVLQTHSSLPAKPYVLRPRAAKRFLQLEVIDSGPGIAPEIRERLFEPFFTTKHSRSKPGTGLGLSLVYSIAQQDGLGLSVETLPGKGTVFSLVIPVERAAPVRETHSSQMIAAP